VSQPVRCEADFRFRELRNGYAVFVRRNFLQIIKPSLLILLSAALLLRSANANEATSKPLPGFENAPSFNEQVLTFTNDLGVRVHINAPSSDVLSARKNVRLIFYGLPNGNSIEQTVGKKRKSDEDWHFEIQHIGAQTRFLREMLTNEAVVVAYLEATTAIGKSWPAWRKKNGDKSIPEILASVQQHFKGYKVTRVLSGHSGGGSFIFGYLNCVEKIPDDIERIAFLDSNYGYETEAHKTKFVNWLKASDKHYLTILAYHDDIALLNGKTFVSAAGGTWGRSHLMKKNFESEMKFSEDVTGDWENYSALDGRLKFFLRENPEKKILHTVQVERNGFIHSMVAGTPNENRGYTYFGDHAYTKFIQSE
jgi:hypothetical protein